MGKQDPAFGVNHFNEAKILSESQTIVNNILLVLFTKPGTYPSQPELGMDISTYLYMFEDEIDTDKIKSDLVYQCNDFLDFINEGTFEVYTTVYNESLMLIFQLPVIIDNTYKELILGVTINNGEMVYNFTFDEEQPAL